MANENGEGKTDKIIAAALGVTKTTPQDIRRRYAHGGLKRALFDAPRPGKERIVTGSDEAHIVSIACTDPPDGHDRWTLNLLTETVPKTVGKTLGRSTIYRVLLRNDLKPWREKNMVHQGKG
jgi:transposase